MASGFSKNRQVRIIAPVPTLANYRQHLIDKVPVPIVVSDFSH
jgi:hypothetical protein